MKPTFLVSPLKAPTSQQFRRHLAYARSALKHSLELGEAAFVPHLLYPTVLADDDESDRALGITAGVAWLARCEAVTVYADLGISPGMQEEISLAVSLKIPVEFRYIKIRAKPLPEKISPEDDKTLDSGEEPLYQGDRDQEGPTTGQIGQEEGTE